MMNDIKLNNGLLIPAIGFGSFPHKEILEETVVSAYDNGYRLFDTSDNYQNESFIGNALRKLPASEVIVETKFSNPYRTKDLAACFEESLTKLGKVDIYLLHWPYPFLWEEQWSQMEDLYLTGRCKAIGVCNFDVPHLKRLLSICRVKPTINQIERHPLFQQAEIVNFCKDNDIQIMSYSPFARMDNDLFGDNNIKQIALKYGKDVSQIIMRWNLESGTIAIPASKSTRHIADNFDVFDFKLTPSDILVLNNMEKGKRVRFDSNTRFSAKEKILFYMYNNTLLYSLYNFIKMK